MLDIAADLRPWLADGRDFAVATVVATHGSAPRPPGAALAVDAGGSALGSISGGCVEGAVYDLCLEAIESGRSLRHGFGYSDADAFEVGLTCGGVIDVLITPVTEDNREVLAEALHAAGGTRPLALARVAGGPPELLGRPLLVRADGTTVGRLGGPARLEREVADSAGALLAAGLTGTVQTAGVTLFVESSLPPPRMIVFGAVDFAAALVRAGKFLGYHVTVCDARPVFATAERFPEADEVVVDWPHRYLESTETDARTVLGVLTHDPKFDVPLLELALRLPVAYVGAMGSRRTHEDRVERLREAGLTAEELSRLRSPIGLDLGARSPAETAISIAAEIVALRRGGTGLPLSEAPVPIHRS
ncbi:XdhC family protein [Streptomyces hoynatensis]|uniref:XdhC/CoxI family protein n=1 Tax=Streptomyces hoynatensis TaxID=1141874 RepID=A0A3A9YWB0_9ACTN|nr:XdhC/CoxI family protein [Streptomyces hoynatensis]RKN39506.1 XdhC/CoxI family protein [Streptomyces hoynatensis]